MISYWLGPFLSWLCQYALGPCSSSNRYNTTRRPVRTVGEDINHNITAVQDYSMAIWRSRNDLLHASNPDSLAIVHASLNTASISQLYSVSSTLSSILQRSYFTLPLEDRLRQSPRQRKRWLRLARLATSHSSANGTRQQLLSTYYPHAPVPPGATSESTRRDAERCPVVPPILLQPPITSYFGPPHM